MLVGDPFPLSVDNTEQRFRELEQKLELLSKRLEQVERRLDVGPVPASVSGVNDEVAGQILEQQLDSSRAAVARWLPLIGRTCLVLGGAFLIRALTNMGTLAQGTGVLLGLTLAAASLGFSHRASRVRARSSAAAHGLTAAVIGYPLAVEATIHLQALPAFAAAAVVALLTAALLMVAWFHQLALLAWMGTVGGLASVILLMNATNATLPLMAILLALAAGTVWLSEAHSWGALKWPAAVVLDSVLLRDVFTSTRETGGPVLWVLGFSAALAGLSLASLVHRTFARSRPLRLFDAGQTLAGLSIGVLAGLRVGAVLGWSSAWVGALALALSLGAFVVALAVIPRKSASSVDFVFYSGLGVGLLFVGGAALTGPPFRGLLWAVFALAAASLARRIRPAPLRWYAAMLAWAGAAGCGVGELVYDGLISNATNPWALPDTATLVMVALVLGAYAATLGRESPSAARVPAAILLVLPALAVTALAADAVHVALGPRGTDPAFLASARTLSVVGMTMLLALGRRYLLQPELGWVAYLFLGLGGVKLLAEDLRRGRAATLVIAFALYGACLILVPRLTRAAQSVAPSADEPRRDPGI
jgi:hypothetical protein